MSTASWRRTLDELAREFGCEVLVVPRHYHLAHPSGWFVSVSRTPSCSYAAAKVRADLRRKASGVWR